MVWLTCSKLFAIIATILAIATYIRYAYQIKKGTSNPNPATVFLWLGEGIINAVTYFYVVQDIWQTLITVTNAILIFIIFLYCLFKAKFTKLGKIEIICLVLVVIITIFWQVSGDDATANILLQIIYIISFFPVGNGILNGKKEHPLAWKLAVVSYLFATLAVLFNYTGEIVSLAYPVINGIIGNGIIVAMIRYQKSWS